MVLITIWDLDRYTRILPMLRCFLKRRLSDSWLDCKQRQKKPRKSLQLYLCIFTTYILFFGQYLGWHWRVHSHGSKQPIGLCLEESQGALDAALFNRKCNSVRSLEIERTLLRPRGCHCCSHQPWWLCQYLGCHYVLHQCYQVSGWDFFVILQTIVKP